MKGDLRFCLVGRGAIGARHLQNLKSLSYNDICSFSLSDDKKKDKEFEKKFEIQCFHNLEDVKRFKPDAFIIANPTSKHLEFARIAIDLNAHIFMEKPVSDSIEGLDAIRTGLLQKNLVFLLANNFRFHPAFVWIKRLIEEKAFGDIYFARIMAGQYLPDWHPWEDYRNGYSAIRKLGGGVVLTLQHEIDYAYWLFGGFKSIKSYAKKISNLQIDVEDVASIIIEGETGQLIEIHLDYLQRPAKRSVQIQGSKGSVDYCVGDKWLEFYHFNEQSSEKIFELSNYDNNEMYVEELKRFIDLILSKNTSVSSFEEACYVLKTCLEVKKGFVH